MGNVLALDLSTKRSGWAIKIDGKLEYGAIPISGSHVEQRIPKMRDAVIEIIKKYPDIDTLVIEEIVRDGKNDHTGKVLMWLQGFIAVAAFELNPAIKIEYVNASHWRSKIGLQKYATKREVQKQMDIQYANDKYNLKLTPSQDDEADAICILSSYETEHNVKIVDGFEFA